MFPALHQLWMETNTGVGSELSPGRGRDGSARLPPRLLKTKLRSGAERRNFWILGGWGEEEGVSAPQKLIRQLWGSN